MNLCKHGIHQNLRCLECEDASFGKSNAGVEAVKGYLAENPSEPVKGYEDLERALVAAFDQAANGKGKERHANDLPFADQPIMQIARMVGIGGHTYQIMKKAQEAGNMTTRGDHQAAIREFYGVINYAAAAVLLIEERKQRDAVAD